MRMMMMMLITINAPLPPSWSLSSTRRLHCILTESVTGSRERKLIRVQLNRPWLWVLGGSCVRGLYPVQLPVSEFWPLPRRGREIYLVIVHRTQYTIWCDKSQLNSRPNWRSSWSAAVSIKCIITELLFSAGNLYLNSSGWRCRRSCRGKVMNPQIVWAIFSNDHDPNVDLQYSSSSQE